MSKMIYYSPAKRWKEALPIGNGKTGAMVYGGVKREIISLNDATLWSGYPRNYDSERCAKSLNQARKLVFDGKYAEADKFVSENMRGEYSESYMPVGDVLIRTSAKGLDSYSRELDFQDGIMRIKARGYNAEVFASYPSGVICYKMTFQDKTDLTISARSKLKSAVGTEGKTLILSGNAPDRVVPNYVRQELRPIKYNEDNGMAFAAALRAHTDGEVIAKGGRIIIRGATSAFIAIATATGFISYDKTPSTDRKACIKEITERLTAIDDYDDEKAKHIADYTAVYGVHSLDIYGEQSDVKSLIKRAKSGDIDKYLVNLMYDYGKYMIVSGSRGGQPLNLQGLWNKSVRPPWSSNLTTNINFQMNYWGAAACNLSVCLEPFYNALREIAERGRNTARINYGADGFCCNHNVDIWRMTSPVKGNPAYMHAPLCGAWIANEAYAHSVTTNGYADNDIIKIAENAARFCLDYLVEYNGKLVTCPSASPEAEYFTSGGKAALGYGSAFETGIIMQCFDNVLSSSGDSELTERIKDARVRLYPLKNTSRGLNEWQGEEEITEKGHRHFSPLYALYPAKQIKYHEGGELLAAAKRLFDIRMANTHHAVGWSAAWAICIAARLHDAERAKKYIGNLASKSIFPNLFGYHPPTYFQIDANLGFVAGVNETLFYEEDGVIDLLPACPVDWSKGSVRGHKICGVTVSIKWENGKVTEICADKNIKVRNINIADGARLIGVTLV